MNTNDNEKLDPDPMEAAGPYTIYSAGGLFIQDELAMNVLIKEAVWRLSKGKFQIFLPQSREVQDTREPAGRGTTDHRDGSSPSASPAVSRISRIR